VAEKKCRAVERNEEVCQPPCRGENEGWTVVCGLSAEELFILNLLYSKRCFASNAGYHSDKLARIFRQKFNKNDDDYVKLLLNRGYLAAIGKSPVKYYIANIGDTAKALGTHGYNVTKGRTRPL
jgi:hypothetical protein